MDEREGKRVLPADVVELALSLSAVAGGEVDRWDGWMDDAAAIDTVNGRRVAATAALSWRGDDALEQWDDSIRISIKSIPRF